jgi:actin-related protein
MMKNKRSMMESEYDVKDIIVIDNGTDSVKIGVSGEDYPRVRPSIRCADHHRHRLRHPQHR